MCRRLTAVAVMLVALAVIGGCVSKPKKVEIVYPSFTEAQQDSVAEASLKSDLIDRAQYAFADSIVKEAWRSMGDRTADDHCEAIDNVTTLVISMSSCMADLSASEYGASYKDVGVTPEHAEKLRVTTARRCGRELMAMFAVPSWDRPEGFRSTRKLTDKIGELQRALDRPDNLGIAHAQLLNAVQHDLQAQVLKRRKLCADELRGVGGKEVYAAWEDRFTSLKADLRWAVDTYKFTAPQLGLTAMELDLLIRDLPSENSELSGSDDYRGGGALVF